MISEEIARSVFNRLAQFDGFRQLTREAKLDYIRAIQSADTAAVAERVIADVIAEDGRERIPTSAYLKRLIEEENDRSKPPTLSQQMAQWKAEFEAEKAQGIDEPSEIRDLTEFIRLQAMKMSRNKTMSPEQQRRHAELRLRLKARFGREERKPPESEGVTQEAAGWHAQLKRIQ